LYTLHKVSNSLKYRNEGETDVCGKLFCQQGRSPLRSMYTTLHIFLFIFAVLLPQTFVTYALWYWLYEK